MNKTQLRHRLTFAVNYTRGLKNTGLSPATYWSTRQMELTAARLRQAADGVIVNLRAAIEKEQ